ncbi:hypothetical protein AbraIFM66951_002955 [Aspergillus brasiliensis]|uniref:Uncharacterized protein n=1 Tax=Aspergillus brasiliensis TaxID=319629 RepID=A0A9W5YML6_9EURO|nr:hypothetical protein AbraCBS73388_005432 [Aspergillus brasiliensis]GKZ50108.1 hypothetical protein AbraIFM66951_002955 [Aspergillus brasiliensis]
MAGGKGVTTYPLVRISPPHINVDLYDSFDELHQRTVDQILSDEASFENSFDDYSGSDGINGDDDMTQSGEEQTSASTAATHSSYVNSPYFPSNKRSKTQKAAQRHISQMDSKDDENDDGSSMTVNGLGGHTVVDNGETLDDASEEDIVFASVDFDKRMKLLTFISSHPFMKKGEYPVLRSARREFVRKIRRKSLSVGMKEADLGKLVAHVKKIYLELYGNNQMSLDGPEFGEEINDEIGAKLIRPKSSNKDNKRKRSTGDDHATMSKPEEKKTTSKKRKSLEPIPNGHDKKRDVVEPDAYHSTAKPPKSHSKVSRKRSADVAKDMPTITINLCLSDNERLEPATKQNVPVKSPTIGQASDEHNEGHSNIPSPPHAEEEAKPDSVVNETTQSEETIPETLPSQQTSIKRSMALRPSPQPRSKHTVGDSEEDVETGLLQHVLAKDGVPSATQAKQPEASLGDRTQHPDRMLLKKERNRRRREKRKQRKKKLFGSFFTNTDDAAPSTSATDARQGRVSKETPGTAKPNATVVDDLPTLDEAFWNLEDF